MRNPMTRDERHHHILETARRLFITEGYDHVTIQDVIKASDVARGTFYLHFDSLESLLIALFDSLVQKTWSRIAPILEEVEDVEACTVETVHAVFGMFDEGEDDAPLSEVFFSGGGAAFMKRREEALYGKLGELVEKSLAKRHGLLQAEAPPEVARNLKWTVVMQIALVANMSHYANTYVDAEDRTAFEHQLVKFVLAGTMNHLMQMGGV